MWKVLLGIQKHLYVSKTNVLEQYHEIERFRWRLKVTETDIKDPGILQPEDNRPLQRPSVAAKLIG